MNKAVYAIEEYYYTWVVIELYEVLEDAEKNCMALKALNKKSKYQVIEWEVK